MIEKERTEQKETMSGTELIMGMEEVVQHIRELEKREENLKEALAQKFYKFYDEMGYDKLSIARTVGPDLGRMVDHLIEENKRIGGRCLEYEVDKLGELVDDEREKVKQLEEENKKLKKKNEEYEAMMIDAEAEDQGRENTIASLGEENKKLKAELEDATSREDSMFQTLNKKREEESVWALKKIAQLKDENKRLKEEVESLEKTLEQAKEVAYNCGVEIFSDSDDPDEI